MRKLYTTLFFIAFTAAFWQACNTINPVEKKPTYIHIDSFAFIANPAFPGKTTSHSITSVWAYYNNNPIGSFDLPATIPVMATGDGQMRLEPAIVVNGRNDELTPYPFFKSDTFTLTAQPGGIVNHIPKTEYFRKHTYHYAVRLQWLCQFCTLGWQPRSVNDHSRFTKVRRAWVGYHQPAGS